MLKNRNARMMEEIETFLDPVKWHRAVGQRAKRVPFVAKESLDFQGPTPSHLP